jgi:hypothetical protein
VSVFCPFQKMTRPGNNPLGGRGGDCSDLALRDCVRDSGGIAGGALPPNHSRGFVALAGRPAPFSSRRFWRIAPNCFAVAVSIGGGGVPGLLPGVWFVCVPRSRLREIVAGGWRQGGRGFGLVSLFGCLGVAIGVAGERGGGATPLGCLGFGFGCCR